MKFRWIIPIALLIPLRLNATNSTRSWSAGDIATSDTRTIATFTFAANVRVNG
jgi:hypothetical protein